MVSTAIHTIARLQIVLHKCLADGCFAPSAAWFRSSAAIAG
jgi:hypothetical protein